MKEEIRALEKVIQSLKSRVAIAAQEPFDLNGYLVEIDIEPGNLFAEILVDGKYASGGGLEGDGVTRLAETVCGRCSAHSPDVVADLEDRIRRAAGF